MEAWREVMGREVLRMDLELIPDQPFYSEVSALLLPGFSVAFAAEAGLRVDRSRPHLTDGMDQFALHICTAGTWYVAQRGREAPLGPGDAALLATTEVGSVICPSLARCAHVQIPRAALAPLVPDLGDAIMRPIPRDSEALRLLVGYIGLLRATPPLADPDTQRLTASHVRDLVAVILGATGDAAAMAEAGGLRAARLRAIKADVTGSLAANPEGDRVSVTAVAGRHGVSPRYVQALFEEDGTTFSGFVLDQRLARAHRLLGDRRMLDRRISDIAFDVGFSDLSYFNRCFRRRYGVTPSDVRAQAIAPPGSGLRPAR